MTMISRLGYLEASTDRTHRAIFFASFRAGMMTETDGGSVTSAGNSSRFREWIARSVAMVGVNTHGSDHRAGWRNVVTPNPSVANVVRHARRSSQPQAVPSRLRPCGTCREWYRRRAKY